MMVKVFQTCDPFRYFPIFLATSRLNRAFCSKNNVFYEAYIGYKVGCFPWHAAYNRIVMFKEFLDKGYEGWVCYLDADAFIVNMEFDLPSYLQEKASHSIVARAVHTHEAPTWDINNGVLFLNFAHSETKKLVNLYAQALQQFTEADFANAPNFHDLIDDQQLLHRILREDKDIVGSMFFESPDLINSEHASFVRQILRSNVKGDLDTRIGVIEGETARFAEQLGIK